MTQAVNLANFANSLNSSGQLDPAALSSSVPVSKGGTGAITASAARTALGVDYSTIVGLIYPVGSLYFNATNSTNPGTLFGVGTWVAFGAGRVPVGYNASNTNFNAAEKTGGSYDAVLVSHTHTSTVSTEGEHTHDFYGAQFFTNTGFNAGDTINTSDQSYTMRTTSAGSHTHTVGISTVGQSSADANIQPYITVFIWKRTA